MPHIRALVLTAAALVAAAPVSAQLPPPPVDEVERGGEALPPAPRPHLPVTASFPADGAAPAGFLPGLVPALDRLMGDAVAEGATPGAALVVGPRRSAPQRRAGPGDGPPHRPQAPADGTKNGSLTVKQTIVHVALVVRDYDEALAFYTQKLHFTVVEDTYQPAQDKRWVVVAPPGSTGTTLLLARATTPEQEAAIGNQTGGRVFLFLNTDDFWRDYQDMVSNGIHFVRAPKVEPYGTVAVFEDLYGNRWDLLELNS